MRKTTSPYDDGWAIAQIRQVWEWAVRQERHYIAFLLGMTILAFELDTGAGKAKAPPRVDDVEDRTPPPRPTAKVR